MEKKSERTLDRYKTAGAWMRLCKSVLSRTFTECSSVLRARDYDSFCKLNQRLEDLCSKAEDNMFDDYPTLDTKYIDIFYGDASIDPRNDVDAEQLGLMQEIVKKMFGSNWK